MKRCISTSFEWGSVTTCFHFKARIRQPGAQGYPTRCKGMIHCRSGMPARMQWRLAPLRPKSSAATVIDRPRTLPVITSCRQSTSSVSQTDGVTQHRQLVHASLTTTSIHSCSLYASCVHAPTESL